MKQEAEKPEYPEIGDLVVCTVKKVTNYGAYVKLDEYDKEGLLHISEIASTWVRNIRSHVREGQKTVLKTLRIDPAKDHIDLSLRRVTGRERKEKMLEWKRAKRAETLLRITGEKLGVDPDQFYSEVNPKLSDAYGDAYAALEAASDRGSEALTEAGVPKEYAGALAETAQDKVRVPRVAVKGILELTCQGPNGVEALREAFKAAESVKKPKAANVKVTVIGAPKYRIEVSAKNYKQAEKLLQNAIEAALSSLEKAGGEGAFKR